MEASKRRLPTKLDLDAGRIWWWLQPSKQNEWRRDLDEYMGPIAIRLEWDSGTWDPGCSIPAGLHSPDCPRFDPNYTEPEEWLGVVEQRPISPPGDVHVTRGVSRRRAYARYEKHETAPGDWLVHEWMGWTEEEWWAWFYRPESISIIKMRGYHEKPLILKFPGA